MPVVNDIEGRKILVVEDDYLIASTMTEALTDEGVEVIGPAGSVETAIALVRGAPEIDGALLDVNLRGEMAFAVADLLMDRGVPIVFTTGYDQTTIPQRYAHVTCCEKPTNFNVILVSLRNSMGLGQAPSFGLPM